MLKFVRMTLWNSRDELRSITVTATNMSKISSHNPGNARILLQCSANAAVCGTRVCMVAEVGFPVSTAGTPKLSLHLNG